MAAADQEIHVGAVRPRSYQDESYQHGFLGTVGDLQKEGELQDVVLEVEGRRFPCHRLVLSAASPYFRAMFTSDMAESRQNTVVLQGLDPDIFEEILSYIYSGTLHVSLDRVQPLYQAADLLQLDYVRDTCSSYMAMNVECSTYVNLYKFAHVFRVDVVLNSCLQYICGHFVEVSSSEEFCSLSVDQLTEIISQDKLEVDKETRVWEAVVRWVQHSREDRLQHLPSILPRIRFNLLTSDDTAAILDHPLVREDRGSSEVIRNIITPKPRFGMTTEMVLLYHEDSNEVMWMNPGETKFIRCHYNLFPVRCTITPDNEIYVLAYIEGSDDVILHKYNHMEDKWEQKSTSYQHGFLGAVGDLQKEGELQDVVLEVEGRRFPCHRLVLSAASPYFRAMFTSDMAESRQQTVVLQGLDADMFEEILSYIYSGTLHVSLDRVQPLYQAADLLQLDYVRDTCSSYMAMNVERSTCVDLYKFADVFMVDVVLNCCLQYICQHFVEVSSSEEFCSLSVDQLTEIISQDKLEVKEETRVWEAVVRWVQHSREDRLQHLPSILPHIRFNLLTSDDTAGILEHPLVREDHGSCEVIGNVEQFGHPNRKPRLGMTTEMVLLSDSLNSNEMLWMNPREGKYIRCHYNPRVLPLLGTVTHDNDIYILAYENLEEKITLYKYNHVQNKWERKSTVYEELEETGDMQHDDYLMEIDGHLFHLLLTWEVVVLKKYNQHTNEWHNCSTPQHDSMSDFSIAVSCSQHIYVITQREIHWYDPREDQWTGKPLSDYSLEVEEQFCAAVGMGTEIFCMDYDFKKTLVYDTQADSWVSHPGFPSKGQDIVIDNCTLFVLQNQLHALVEYGDYSRRGQYKRLQHIFVYDRSEDVWREYSTFIIINMAAAHQETHASSVRPRSYQDESYQRGFLGAVGDLQKEGELQDVVLEVEGRRFPCHRLVLSTASPYFRAMFTSDMAESRQNTVVLQGLDADMFEEILSYIYSGTLHVSLDRVQPLYQAADLLQLDYVRDTCSSYMAMNVERSTCVDLYKFAEVFSVRNILNPCLQYIVKNFTEVSSSEEFYSLSVDQLTEIISQDKLEVKEETRVWEAVVRWVQHSREDRLQHLPSILPHIRFNLLTSDDTAAILEHPVVREDHGTSEVIRNLVQTRNPKLRPRLGMTTEMVLLSNIETMEDEILYMNPQEGMYISCTEDIPDGTLITVTKDNDIYGLINGRGEEYYQLSMLKYNHVDNVWEDADMSSVSAYQREYSGMFTQQDECLLEVDGILYYLAADLGEVSALVRMKKYDQRTDQWQECSQLLLEGKWDHSTALSCGSYIYFLTDSAMYHYNPSQDCWCKRTPPNLWCDSRWIIAAALGTEIFCTNYTFSEAMVYNTESDCWQKLPSWPNQGNRSVEFLPNFFVLDNQVHILLETYDGDKPLGSSCDYLVYVYDRAADVWRDLKATLPNIKKQYHVRHPMCPVARIYIPYLKGAQKHITCYGFKPC
ncbi:PREDICTED: uncharacterized protein LOC109474632 [Branchiostoma belcheri]|uniref:Uncharacterized protein LOC109474632 n=1 Tax=Branchiostoma belcheri TaxID=7741 RepID=A0A6P4YM37_BRABE|nr:PREDICTED: uncharacterized protein LOC109474632 [Branchiostoma belcheri]